MGYAVLMDIVFIQINSFTNFKLNNSGKKEFEVLSQ